MNEELLKAAEEYAKIGWITIPVAVSIKKDGKKKVVFPPTYQNIKTLEEARATFDTVASANGLAVLCGPSKLTVLDIDSNMEDGETGKSRFTRFKDKYGLVS